MSSDTDFDAFTHVLSMPEALSGLTKSREALLRVFLERTDPKPEGVAGLWLLDNSSAPILTLWAVTQIGGSKLPLFARHTNPRQTTFDTKHFRGENHAVLKRDLGFDNDRDMSVWLAAEKGIGKGAPQPYQQVLIPIVEREGNEAKDKLIGVVVLVIPGSVAQELLSSPNRYERLIELARLTGAWLRFNRRARTISAIEAFQARIERTTEPRKVAQAAAEILSEQAGANIGCGIYLQTSSNDLERIAWSTSDRVPDRTLGARVIVPLNSLTGWFHFESKSDYRIVRVLNVNDSQQVTEAFGQGSPPLITADFEGVNREEGALAMMSMRIACRGAIEGEIAPFLTIKMLGRPSENFIGGTFSRTNQDILERTGIYLRDLMPGLLFRQKMRQVTTRLIDEADRLEVRLTDERPDFNKQPFARLAETQLSTVGTCYVVETTNESEKRHYEITGSGGRLERGPAWLDEALQPTNGKIQQAGSGIFVLCEPVFTKSGRSVALVCRCSGPVVPEYEYLILQRIASELNLAMIRGLDLDDWLQQLADVRHNLRGSIHAVINCTHDMVTTYDLAKEYSAEDAHYLMFTKANFRKKIENVQWSTAELQALFENGRLLLKGKYDLQYSSVNLPELVRDWLLVLRPEVERRKLDVDFQNEIPRNLDDITADRSLISILLFNLLDNAIKYSHQHQMVRINLSLFRRYWRLTVANVGQFIEPGRRDAIFRPFTRFGPVKGQQTMPGTGLGLPAVKRIVELHARPPDGKIEVASEPEEWRGSEVTRAFTTFTVTLPRERTGSGR